jgi:hypothetical protein
MRPERSNSDSHAVHGDQLKKGAHGGNMVFPVPDPVQEPARS